MDCIEPEESAPIILLVDDDTAFATALARGFERRGYAIRLAGDAETAMAALAPRTPEYAVIDLCLPGGSGLALIRRLRSAAPGIRIVMLTGYGSIASAVGAVKLGADGYLTKPVMVDEVLAALERSDEVDLDTVESLPHVVPSVYRVEWEHIHRVLAEQDGNISESARLLGMHRRTLQRKLSKHPVRR